MGYVDQIPEEQRAKYRIIDDWAAYAEENIPHNNDEWLMPKLENLIVKTDAVIRHDGHRFAQIENCFFEGNLVISGCFNNRLLLDDCYVDGNLELQKHVDIKVHFAIRRGGISHLIMHGCHFEYADIEEVEIGTMHVGAASFDELRIKGKRQSTIDECIFHCSDIQGAIIFNGYHEINKLSISGTLRPSASITIIGARFRLLDLYFFRNEGVLRFSNITGIYPDPNHPEDCWESTLTRLEDGTKYTEKLEWLPIIHIAQSHLGKAEFTDCRFDMFESILVSRSQLVECIFNNTNWPEHRDRIGVIELANRGERMSLSQARLNWDIIVHKANSRRNKAYHFRKHESYNRELRETFRQIKYAMSKQGDFVREHQFHILEMRAYDDSLHWNRKNFFTKLIIKLSFFTSEFGQSFSRPLLCLVGAHLLLFLIAVCFGAIPTLTLTGHPDVKGFNEDVYQFFILINPLHKNDGQFQGWTIVWDVFIRINSSYMIYNLVRASRRFIR